MCIDFTGLNKACPKDNFVAEPPKLFQLKCLSHASGAVTHLNRNNPSVLQISSDRATLPGSNSTISLEGESQKKYNKTGNLKLSTELLHKSEFLSSK
jgi:hypothetical protein